MPHSNRIYLSLGSSQGNTQKNLEDACEEIQKWGTDFEVSSFVFSKPWGGVAKNMFCNAVCTLKTTLTPEELLEKIHHTEKNFGRVRNIRWEDRPLDIDILLYGDQNIHTKTLTIPHPYMWERDFVRQPFLELLAQK